MTTEARLGRIPILRRDGKTRLGYIGNCDACGKVFRGFKREQKFCSKSCATLSHPGNEAHLHTHTCCLCGKTFRKAASSMRGSGDVVFCDNKCYGEAKKLEYGLFGKQNPTPKSALRIARRLLKQECSSCGETRAFLLQNHHIDGNHNNNPLDCSNWEIVCANCHQIRHLAWSEEAGAWIHNNKSLTPREDLDLFYSVLAPAPLIPPEELTGFTTEREENPRSLALGNLFGLDLVATGVRQEGLALA